MTSTNICLEHNRYYNWEDIVTLLRKKKDTYCLVEESSIKEIDGIVTSFSAIDNFDDLSDVISEKCEESDSTVSKTFHSYHEYQSNNIIASFFGSCDACLYLKVYYLSEKEYEKLNKKFKSYFSDDIDNDIDNDIDDNYNSDQTSPIF